MPEVLFRMPEVLFRIPEVLFRMPEVLFRIPEVLFRIQKVLFRMPEMVGLAGKGITEKKTRRNLQFVGVAGVNAGGTIIK